MELPTTDVRASKEDRPSIVAVVSALLVVVAVVRAAWLCDDAFITLRTVDNWVHGYGLRWNIGERVQAFTHPAWLFLVSLAYRASPSASFALLAPGIALTCVFVTLLMFARRDAWLAAGACLLLLASKGFVEFSTSGLENSLLHVLLLVYLMCTANTLRTRSKLWRTVACASLILCTRLDVLWLIGPSLAGAAWIARKELRCIRTWLATTPIVAWEAFSLVYYGFPLPNTAYAKLNTGVPAEEAFSQGLQCLSANAYYDAPTLLIIGTAALVGFARRSRTTTLFAAGLALWIVYLVRIGGDFMLGRLLTPALIVAVWVWTEFGATRAKYALVGIAAACVIAAAALPRSALLGAPREQDTSWLPERVTDERALSFAYTGLFRTSHPEGPKLHPYTKLVLERVARGERVVPARSIGFAGYFAGPAVHLVDEFALAEPLLARLPADPGWSPGHFERRIPDGYARTLESGRNQIADPTLAKSYDALSVLTRAPVFAWSRMDVIVRWNLKAEVMHSPDYQVRRVPIAELLQAPGEGRPVRKTGTFATDRQGLAVVLPQPTAVRHAAFALDRDDRYLIAFRREGHIVWQTWLEPVSHDKRRLGVRTVSAPRRFVVDSILVRGRRGDLRYHVGRVTLN